MGALSFYTSVDFLITIPKKQEKVNEPLQAALIFDSIIDNDQQILFPRG
jgi:hypothetical protein